MKNFSNFFVLKMIFLNILQNVAICVYLKILCCTLTMIPQNNTLLHHRTNQISLQYFCHIILQNTLLMLEYINSK